MELVAAVRAEAVGCRRRTSFARWGDQYSRAMHSSPRRGRGGPGNYTRAGGILLGAVLTGMVALVVGPTQVGWSASRVVLSLLMGVTAALTIRYMPIRLPGELSFDGGESTPDSASKPRTAIIAMAALAGGAVAPLLAGVGAFFFLLAIVAGLLFGVSVKVILRIRSAGDSGSLDSQT